MTPSLQDRLGQATPRTLEQCEAWARSVGLPATVVRTPAEYAAISKLKGKHCVIIAPPGGVLSLAPAEDGNVLGDTPWFTSALNTLAVIGVISPDGKRPRIHGNCFRDTRRGTRSPLQFAGKRLVVDGIEISDFSGPAIGMGGPNARLLVRDCVIHHCAAEGMIFTGYDPLEQTRSSRAYIVKTYLGYGGQHHNCYFGSWEATMFAECISEAPPAGHAIKTLGFYSSVYKCKLSNIQLDNTPANDNHWTLGRVRPIGSSVIDRSIVGYSFTGNNDVVFYGSGGGSIFSYQMRIDMATESDDRAEYWPTPASVPQAPYSYHTNNAKRFEGILVSRYWSEEFWDTIYAQQWPEAALSGDENAQRLLANPWAYHHIVLANRYRIVGPGAEPGKGPELCNMHPNHPGWRTGSIHPAVAPARWRQRAYALVADHDISMLVGPGGKANPLVLNATWPPEGPWREQVKTTIRRGDGVKAFVCSAGLLPQNAPAMFDGLRLPSDAELLAGVAEAPGEPEQPAPDPMPVDPLSESAVFIPMVRR